MEWIRGGGGKRGDKVVVVVKKGVGATKIEEESSGRVVWIKMEGRGMGGCDPAAHRGAAALQLRGALNGNSAIDLDDVQRALSDGVDQDGNGRIDDLCGWDFDRQAPLVDAADAGRAQLRSLVAPIDDAREGLGVCPGCTVVPIGFLGQLF